MPVAVSTTDRSGLSELRALQQQLNSALDALSSADEAPLVPLNVPSSAPAPLSTDAIVARATAKRIAALLGGQIHTFESAFSFHVPAALRVAIEAHVTEVLREAAAKTRHPDEGVLASEIAKVNGIDGAKLARVLRVLAAHHIFREVAPDRFANNRCSLALDTGKSVNDLVESKEMYTDTDGRAALIAHVADDGFKGAGYLSDVLLSPNTAHSYSASETALAKAFGIDTPPWEYWAKPENAASLHRFGYAMKGTQALQNGQDVGGFPWQSLPQDALVVDVGGGVGSLDLEILKVAPQVKVVVQDREEVIPDAQEVWQASGPEHLSSGRATLVAHDFFTPQPISNADVFVLRFIIHDWSDEPATTILSHLSAAAQPSTKLVLIEQTYASLADTGGFVPTPLPYLTDSQMLVALNALERTEAQYEKLARGAGWELVKVWKTGEGGKDGGFRHYEFRLAGPRE
ncbi:hypothetical protein JCM10449v2_006384 [Rhodotorula kratochvilovae]